MRRILTQAGGAESATDGRWRGSRSDAEPQIVAATAAPEITRASRIDPFTGIARGVGVDAGVASARLRCTVRSGSSSRSESHGPMVRRGHAVASMDVERGAVANFAAARGMSSTTPSVTIPIGTPTRMLAMWTIQPIPL